MPRGLPDVHLTNYDDIFSTQEERSRDAAAREVIQEIPLTELHPFKGHPFKVLDDEAMQKTVDSIREYGVLTPAIARPLPEGGYELISGHRRHHASELAGKDTMPVIVRDLDDEAMQKTVESIREYGVLTPAIARPLPDGGYELISGHRRHHASELAGKDTMPVIVRDLDDDAATILMVDSNLQREELLPSERAFAYKMKLEAINHQGQRQDLTSSQVGTKLQRSIQQVADEASSSRMQVHRFIRLTNLVPELLEMVDQKRISFNPAVELSYLKPEEQQNFLEAYDMSGEVAPSLSQTQRMKRMSQANMCTLEAMCAILSEDKKMPEDRVVFNSNDIKSYFPKSYSSTQMHDTIIKLLEQWQRRRDRNQSL